MNREQRRHPETQEPGQESPKEDPARELAAKERNPEDFSVRAKSSGHKKKTADKWNQ
jgi:hypothetical protein